MAGRCFKGRRGDSQFPFWDFFCCNLGKVGRGRPLPKWAALNSLFGISFVVTAKRVVFISPGLFRALNSLFGISFVVTLATQGELYLFGWLEGDSQFPFWDFFCCNSAARAYPTRWGSHYSQFPFWDFFCCNQNYASQMQHLQPGNMSLNSLFGISFVVTLATQGELYLFGWLEGDSQFPFWDFFCCNTAARSGGALAEAPGALSIPFLGFLLL